MNEKIMIFSLVFLLVFSLPTAFADEDEFEEEEDERGLGETQREHEREQEHEDDDDSLAFGSGSADLVLYVTIGAIIAAVGFTGFKILKTKKTQVQKNR